MEHAMNSDHRPRRPYWSCQWCSTPWPCGSAQDSLLATYDGATVSLCLFMGQMLVEACIDLGNSVGGGDLYDRFLVWVRHAHRHGQPGTESPRRSAPYLPEDAPIVGAIGAKIWT
jgi:hypothetical protein